MTRSERASAMEAICACESRCHGWSEQDVAQLRTDITAWWSDDAMAAEDYLAAESANAKRYLAEMP